VPAGYGQGGGIYSVGSLLLENSTLRSNVAQGGSPGIIGYPAGNGYGGGLYVAGTATLLQTVVTENGAVGHTGTGGGIFVAAGAQLGLDEFTLAHTTGNAASTSHPDIFGTYELIANPNPLPGDFNHDGTVDAADYVVWRKGLGTTYNPDHYIEWRENFGRTRINGSGAGATGMVSATVQSLSMAVPEPATFMISFVGVLLTRFRRRA
jgi:hypothetical protein